MYIAVLGAIATNDLLPESVRQSLGHYPIGRAGAPLISTLIQEYIGRGHRVLAITTDPKLQDDADPFVYESPQLTYVVVPSRKHIFRLNGKRGGRVADFYRFERKQMLTVLQRYQPDVVHAHWTYEFALAALAYTPNALITVHDNAQTIFRYVRTLERFFMMLMARNVFQKGHWFTAVSPYMAESIQFWTVQPVTVVPNPVPIPVRNDLPYDLGNPIISVVVNGWDARKNNENALLAFKGLQLLRPTARLWAFGTAFEPVGAAEAFCREHQITNVELYGVLPHREVLGKVSQSSMLLHTSLEESFGMVLAEAMSFGIPVVAGQRSGAVPWVVEDGGLLVDVTRVDNLVRAMDGMLSAPSVYQQLSERARQIVKTRFSVQQIASEYLAIYQRCMVGAKEIERATSQPIGSPTVKSV